MWQRYWNTILKISILLHNMANLWSQSHTSVKRQSMMKSSTLFIFSTNCQNCFNSRCYWNTFENFQNWFIINDNELFKQFLASQKLNGYHDQILVNIIHTIKESTHTADTFYTKAKEVWEDNVVKWCNIFWERTLRALWTLWTDIRSDRETSLLKYLK